MVRGSAWGEGFPLSTTQQTTRHVTPPRVVATPILYDLLLSYHLLLSFHFLLATPVFVIGQAPITVALINLALP